MLMFHIRVKTGDADNVHRYHFTFKDRDNVSEEEQAKKWDEAVKELNHIYQDYGRFATRKGVYNFFEYHGFEMTIP